MTNKLKGVVLCTDVFVQDDVQVEVGDIVNLRYHPSSERHVGLLNSDSHWGRWGDSYEEIKGPTHET